MYSNINSKNMPIEKDKIEKKLRESFPDAEITLTALVDDNDHWALHIKSSRFNGLRLVEQHQLVNQALSEYLKHDLHALQIKTEEM